MDRLENRLLYKKGKYLGWKRRQFVLKGNVLQCLKPDGRPYKTSTLQSTLEISELNETSSGKHVFVISSGKTRITLGTDTTEQRTLWVKSLLALAAPSTPSVITNNDSSWFVLVCVGLCWFGVL